MDQKMEEKTDPVDVEMPSEKTEETPKTNEEETHEEIKEQHNSEEHQEVSQGEEENTDSLSTLERAIKNMEKMKYYVKN